MSATFPDDHQHTRQATSILDLSQEILQEIFLHLWQSDLLACLTVSRAFFTASEGPLHCRIILFKSASLPKLLHALLDRPHNAPWIRDLFFICCGPTRIGNDVLALTTFTAQVSTLQYILQLTRQLRSVHIGPLPTDAVQHIHSNILSLPLLREIRFATDTHLGFRGFNVDEIRQCLDKPTLTQIIIFSWAESEHVLQNTFDSLKPIRAPLQEFSIQKAISSIQLHAILACIGGCLTSLKIGEPQDETASNIINCILATVGPKLRNLTFEECGFDGALDPGLEKFLEKLPLLESAEFCASSLAETSLIWLSPQIRTVKLVEDAVTAKGLALAIATWKNLHDVRIELEYTRWSIVDKEIVELVRQKAKGVTIVYED